MGVQVGDLTNGRPGRLERQAAAVSAHEQSVVDVVAMVGRHRPATGNRALVELRHVGTHLLRQGDLAGRGQGHLGHERCAPAAAPPSRSDPDRNASAVVAEAIGLLIAAVIDKRQGHIHGKPSCDLAPEQVDLVGLPDHLIGHLATVPPHGRARTQLRLDPQDHALDRVLVAFRIQGHPHLVGATNDPLAVVVQGVGRTGDGHALAQGAPAAVHLRAFLAFGGLAFPVAPFRHVFAVPGVHTGIRLGRFLGGKQAHVGVPIAEMWQLQAPQAFARRVQRGQGLTFLVRDRQRRQGGVVLGHAVPVEVQVGESACDRNDAEDHAVGVGNPLAPVLVIVGQRHADPDREPYEVLQIDRHRLAEADALGAVGRRRERVGVGAVGRQGGGHGGRTRTTHGVLGQAYVQAPHATQGDLGPVVHRGGGLDPIRE